MKLSSAHVLSVCLVAVCLLHGCAAHAPGAASPKRRLAFVTNNAGDFWSIARRGTERAAQELGDVEVEFRVPQDGTAAEQRRIIEELLASGVSGIAISPVDPANQTQMINDAARRVLVMTQDSDAPSSDRVCYLGTDNLAAGRQAGQLIKEALPQGGKIMLFVGKADAQNARERLAGIRQELAGSNIEILDLRTDDTDRARARSNAADTLVKYPDVAGLVGLWGYNGPAILSAVRDAGKAGQVKIVAFDEEDETLAGVRDGSIHGTIVQQPYEFGYESIRTMARLLGGDSSMIPPSRQILIPTLVIKQESVDEFTDKLNQLRGRG